MDRLKSVPLNPRMRDGLSEADRPKEAHLSFEDSVGLIEGCSFNQRKHLSLLSVIFGHSEYCMDRWRLVMVQSLSRIFHLSQLIHMIVGYGNAETMSALQPGQHGHVSIQYNTIQYNTIQYNTIQ